jgi:predicted phosphodiesterase
MHILIVSDLHHRRDWYHWLSLQKADLTVIAGDLMDGFDSKGGAAQMLYIDDWCRSFAGPLALCSGNHDANGIEVRDPDAITRLPLATQEQITRIILHENWMDALARPGLVTDRRSEVLMTPSGEIVVTTTPFSFLQEPDKETPKLWREGSLLRKKRKLPWIVLHHEPPGNSSVGGLYGDRSLFYRICESRPDFVVSGHQHEQPYLGTFAEKVASTWCFNPGHPELQCAAKSPIPNHIILNLTEKTASWYASSPGGLIQKTISIT